MSLRTERKGVVAYPLWWYIIGGLLVLTVSPDKLGVTAEALVGRVFDLPRS